jgi:predicted DNA-binding transcriptional regulator YafY
MLPPQARQAPHIARPQSCGGKICWSPAPLTGTLPAMARGDSLARQFSLIRLLEERHEVAVADAARELGYTRRTIYRDLAVLERVGFPIYQDRIGSHVRWRFVDGYRCRMTLSLSFAEMLALFTGRELLAGLSGTVFHDAAKSALDKVRAAVPKELARRTQAAASLLGATAEGRKYSKQTAEIIDRILAALEQRETVEMSYRKVGSRRAVTRRVDPYHLHVKAGAIYLIGYCHARQQVRTFLINRVDSLKGTGRFFEREETFSPAEIMQGSFGPWSGRKERVRLRFSAEVAPFVAERQLHASQQMQWRGDGELDLRMDLPLSPPLVAWVLSWGAHVTVLAPARLAERVRQEHRRAAERESNQ